MPAIDTAKTPKRRKLGDPPVRRHGDASAPADTTASSALSTSIVTVRYRKNAALTHALDITPEERKPPSPAHSAAILWSRGFRHATN